MFESLPSFIDFFIHLDHHINHLMDTYGVWSYLILFLIIFCETGLVVTPFLPGDSLLFVLGALTVGGTLKLNFLWFLLALAAVLGDTINYGVGKILGSSVMANKKIPFVHPSHLEKTKHFFERYGGKTIILARFVPIIRTFAPFLAGAGTMRYGKFILYNIIGGLLWVSIGLFSGYFFGNIPWVRKNFTFVILMIIVISLLPAVFELLKHRPSKQKI